MKLRATPLAILCMLLSAITPSKAQDIEAGLFIGAAQYQGDITENQITFGETQPSFGGLFRYYFHPRLNFKANVYFGWIAGDDQNYDGDNFRYKRNLSFRSHVLEGSAQLEFNILPFVSGSDNYGFAPYIFGGIALYNFNPQAEYNGSWEDLQPLGTEGQGLPDHDDPYSLTQVSIPYGIGLKYSLGGGWNLGLELGQRKTFTDYLDDVSTNYPDKDALRQENGNLAVELSDRSDELPEYNTPQFNAGDGRGNSGKKDLYLFTGFTITKTFRSYQCTGSF